MSPVIDLQGVDFYYGKLPVLTGIDLQVMEGEFIGVVGPNAGGKSTLLKLLLGLLQPDAGKIRVLGRKPSAASHLLGYLPQYPSFPRDFPITVEQVVQLGRIGYRQPGGWRGALLPGRVTRADREAAQKALAEVEAGNIATRQIGRLSGGQLQRVLLALLPLMDSRSVPIWWRLAVAVPLACRTVAVTSARSSVGWTVSVVEAKPFMVVSACVCWPLAKRPSVVASWTTVPFGTGLALSLESRTLIEMVEV